MDKQNASNDVSPSPEPLDETYSSKAIFALAIPALGTLVIEPALTFIDSVMVGHLGTASLAGLGVGAAVLNTAVGLFVFLAYATTASTAGLLGSGDKRGALRNGIGALWLGVLLGLVMMTVAIIFAPQLVGLLGADETVGPYASSYLRFGAPGMAAMFIIMAATGVLRGFMNTRTPLIVLAIGAPVNIAGNFLLIYGLNLGIVGAGISLSLTQILMATILVTIVMKAARKNGVERRFRIGGLWVHIKAGWPLFLRTASLRLALLATLYVAARGGTEVLAAHQVAMSIWNTAAFALDALAIAAQSLVAHAIGAGRQKELKAVIRRVTGWGLIAGIAIGTVIAATSKWTPTLFGPSQQMHEIASLAVLIAGLTLPIGAITFELDGILIGAGEGRFLAEAGVVTLLLYLPALAGVYFLAATTASPNSNASQWLLGWLWISFSGWFMLVRAATNWIKAGKLGA